MLTKWHHERPNGSTNDLGIGFEGPGVGPPWRGVVRVGDWKLEKVDWGEPGKEDSNAHGARLVHLIMTMIMWIRTRSFVHTQLSLGGARTCVAVTGRGSMSIPRMPSSAPAYLAFKI